MNRFIPFLGLTRVRRPLQRMKGLIAINKLDYQVLCHQLEAQVDLAISRLAPLSGKTVDDIRRSLKKALIYTENEIIKERNNVIPFPVKES